MPPDSLFGKTKKDKNGMKDRFEDTEIKTW